VPIDGQVCARRYEDGEEANFTDPLGIPLEQSPEGGEAEDLVLARVEAIDANDISLLQFTREALPRGGDFQSLLNERTASGSMLPGRP
jgi:hypothetical protein